MDIRKIFLLPSEICFSHDPVEIATLLGSCVAVCFFNQKYKFGGMNHFMLDKTPPGAEFSAKYGDYAMQTLVQMMLDADNDVDNIVASVIGGGNVVGHLNVENGIGARNIAMAQSILQENNIRIINNSYVGGDNGRKVRFNTWAGDLEIKEITNSFHADVVKKGKNGVLLPKIRVLVVDDSKMVRAIIINAISEDPQIEVIGEAENPYEARQLLLEYNPDVICLDIIMPKMDGLTFLKKLFLYMPKPVIIISTIVQKDSKIREQAKKIGAVDIIDKADLALYSKDNKIKSILTAKIKDAALAFVAKKTNKELDNI